MVRFHGRADSTWNGGARTAAERFRYLLLRHGAAGARRSRSPNWPSEAAESHLLMNNCYRDYGVRNAAQLRELLSEA